MKKTILLITIILLVASACDKAGFLDKKPNTSLLVPTKLTDFEKLLDNLDMNVAGVMAEISSDNYYLADDKAWTSLKSPMERNGYVWAKDLYEGQQGLGDWYPLYKQVLYANIVLDGLAKFTSPHQFLADFDRIKGWALFIRGQAFFHLAQVFAPPYDPPTATSELGIPLRLEPDVTVKTMRASVEETYARIIDDLKSAAVLLPDRTPGVDRARPYRSAAFGLLARVYLSMRDYEEALHYADAAMALYKKLIDFNRLDTDVNLPFSTRNEEVLYWSNLASGGISVVSTYRTAPNTLVDSLLYLSYDENDLRKQLFFTMVPAHNKPGYKGSFSGTARKFGGIATDELYLIKAECEVRKGDYNKGMEVLNDLLIKRWKTDTYEPFEARNMREALAIVLEERRKELVFRSLRWQDLRRLNKEGAEITLQRHVGGTTYVLPPNSPLYVLPIPPDEIQLSGIEQNKR